MMRAITPAWLDMPPLAVRMPVAAFMPSISEGPVSFTTNMQCLPRARSRAASSALKVMIPLAAPGETPRPVAIGATPSGDFNRGWVNPGDGVMRRPDVALDPVHCGFEVGAGRSLHRARRQELHPAPVNGHEARHVPPCLGVEQADKGIDGFRQAGQLAARQWRGTERSARGVTREELFGRAFCQRLHQHDLARAVVFLPEAAPIAGRKAVAFEGMLDRPGQWTHRIDRILRHGRRSDANPG
jgi:hypothetical protein